MALTVQFYTMVAMAAMGICLGAAVDTYGRFLPRQRTFRIHIALLDIAFWIVQALLVFYILFKTNQGDIRIYVFLALLCGYAAYQALFKGVYNWLVNLVITIVQAVLRFVWGLLKAFIVMPIKWLLMSVRRFVMIIVISVWSIILYVLLKPLYWLMKKLGVVGLLKKGQPILRKWQERLERFRKKDER
ncbi:spore cortex biosynthesis protein YabQ [Shouchella clausii]|uniref:spore cortex biosynthesis protein YabQ n=1 Tax=Shouchella clausii TaxID=79880 RepID=UPI000D1DC6D8|nr:spore cortex biosynthesis protein YabQ [Shouchella clausii]PTL22270.1 spore cortex biosynthesis protein YabQ [Shouchella clausii]